MDLLTLLRGFSCNVELGAEILQFMPITVRIFSSLICRQYFGCNFLKLFVSLKGPIFLRGSQSGIQNQILGAFFAMSSLHGKWHNMYRIGALMCKYTALV